MEDRVIIQRIIHILELPAEDYTDGELLDQIYEVIETTYTIDR